MTTTVLVVDDHPVVRTGLRALVGTLPDLEVVGEAVDGASAVERVRELRPDVVVMDLRMPGMDGVTATTRIREVAPEVAVLVMTMSDDDATVLAAMRAGARGYLLKGAGQAEIHSALLAVSAGQAVFGPGVASRVVSLLDGARRDPTPHPFPQLTDREREILDLLAAGRRTSEIGAALFLSPKTVSNHLTSVFAKLQVSDRTAAVVRARESGLGPPR